MNDLEVGFLHSRISNEVVGCWRWVGKKKAKWHEKGSNGICEFLVPVLGASPYTPYTSGCYCISIILRVFISLLIFTWWISWVYFLSMLLCHELHLCCYRPQKSKRMNFPHMLQPCRASLAWTVNHAFIHPHIPTENELKKVLPPPLPNLSWPEQYGNSSVNQSTPAEITELTGNLSCRVQ